MAKNISRSKDDVLFDIINYTILTLILVSVAYPLYFILVASISDPTAVNTGKALLHPVGLNFDGYRRLFEHRDIWIGYRNTILYTLVGTTINVTLTMMISYPLSRKVFAGKNFIMLFLMITLYFHGGLIPTYLLVQGLGLYNNWLVMVILGAVSVFNIIIARTFIQANIPEELYEAAVMDGCGHIPFFIKIVLPLSKAIMAVLALYYGIGHWNEFFKGLIYLRDKNLYPLQLFLRSILIQSEVDLEMVSDIDKALEQQQLVEQIKYGLIVIASLPVLMLYPFLQKYFVKGVMIGSIKR